MAIMLPASVWKRTSSDAERRLFRIIRDELSDDWYALHSLGLAGHERKPWAEIDFVFIGPAGIFCLEVKGGRIERRDGKWIFTNRRGHSDKKDEGPFEQVGSASAALAKYLFDMLPGLRSSVIGYAVATPDQSGDRMTGPDVMKDVLYDETDLDRPFSEFISRISHYWHERLGREGNLTSAEIRAVVNKLRGDFDLRPTLRAQVSEVFDELVTLTAEQDSLIEGLVDSPRVIVRGGAGTGKTLLAIEEALRWSTQGARVLLTCYNVNLAHFMRRALDDEQIHVEHFHALMFRIIRDAKLEGRLPEAEPSDLFDVFYPELALEALLDDSESRFDVLVVDEGQDLLRDNFLDVFDALVEKGLRDGSWRFFLDPRQNVYETLEAGALHRLEAFRPSAYKLTKNCRNTIPIAFETAVLAARAVEETLQAEGPEVRVVWYEDDAEQARLISKELKRLLNGGIQPQDVTILGRYRIEHSPTMQKARHFGSGIVDLRDGPEGLFSSKTRFSTIGGFKGLESDVVLVVDGDDVAAERSRNYFYVASSRARALLVVFLRNDQRAAYKSLAEEFGARALLSEASDSRGGE